MIERPSKLPHRIYQLLLIQMLKQLILIPHKIVIDCHNNHTVLLSIQIVSLYIVDTGSNRIIVNGVKYLSGLIPTSDKVKGIGSNYVQIVGVGKLSLQLKSDEWEI